MTEHDIYATFRQILAKESNRGLGDIPGRATAALSPFSQAQMFAATNLLNKALRALDDDDEARARRFVERVAALPYDDHEGGHPGARMAHQQMFVTVTDALEGGEDLWLDAVADTFASAPEGAKYVLRDVMTAVLQDYELSAGERQRVRRLIKDIPERGELHDLGLPPEELATAILEVLDGVIHFVDAIEEIDKSPYGQH